MEVRLGLSTGSAVTGVGWGDFLLESWPQANRMKGNRRHGIAGKSLALRTFGMIGVHFEVRGILIPIKCKISQCGNLLFTDIFGK